MFQDRTHTFKLKARGKREEEGGEVIINDLNTVKQSELQTTSAKPQIISDLGTTGT